MQGDIRNDSSQGLKVGFILDRMVSAQQNKKKKKLNSLEMSFGLVKNSPLFTHIIFGDSGSLVFQEIIDLIPFQVLSLIITYITIYITNVIFVQKLH